MHFSIITPVYNRPQEVDELLDTLQHQTFKDFEVLIIEDGSTIPSDKIVEAYRDRLNIRYFFKQKEGPSAGRNFGFEQAAGDYFILFDSDLLVPPDYFAKVVAALEKNHWDCFGGPDRAHDSFTDFQKAVNYSMTSPLTTGGIRGEKKHVGQFHPRSFNLGLSRQVYNKVGGFIDMHPGEDIDFSIRIIKAGFKVGLIADAFVYHKRRTSIKKFYRQVYKFGYKRIEIAQLHPTELKLTHFFPTAFSLYMTFAVAVGVYSPMLGLMVGAPLLLYLLIIAADSTIYNKSLKVGLMSVFATLIQMFGYGYGLAEAIVRRLMLKQQ